MFSALSARLRCGALAAPGACSSLHAPFAARRSKANPWSAATGDVRAAASAADGSANASSSSSDSPRVCILGGGFGGLYVAVKLESLIWPKGKKPRVTLIDQGDRFVFKPLLYELLNGTAQAHEVAPTFAQLLAPYPVQFLQARVTGVEADGGAGAGAGAGGGRVLLEGGGAVEYDWLVVSLGAESDPRGVPGVKELARPFVTLEDAVYVNERLSELEAAAAAAAPPPTVVVVGAGYAGVELCSVIAERVRGRGVEVRLVTPADDILAGSPGGQREAARKALADLGVATMPRRKVDRLSEAPAPAGAAAGEADAGEPRRTQGGGGRCVVHLEDVDGSGGGSELEADLVVWTAGSAPVSKFVKSLPFPSSRTGAIETEPTLRVRDHPGVFALGDVSFTAQQQQAQQQSYPATAQVAFQQADYAAWNIWAAINGRPLLPFRYQHLGSMMSLGAANAAVALPVELPEPVASTLKGSPLEGLLSLAGVKATAEGGVTLEGPLAQVLRRAAYLYRQPTNEQRLSVAAGWVQQAADMAARLAQEVADRQGPARDGSRRS